MELPIRYYASVTKQNTITLTEVKVDIEEKSITHLLKNIKKVVEEVKA